MDSLKPQIVRSNRRSLSLQILPNKTLVIRAPLFLPQKEIDKFIERNKNWIENRLEKLQENNTGVRQYINGERFLYLGKSLTLKIGDFSVIEVVGEELHFPRFMEFRIKKELDMWLINEAKKIVNEYLKVYSDEMGTSYRSVTFSDTRSKWGSCSHDNRLQFCWRLIMAPPLVIRYVVVHELTHTLEKNHSARFWIKVRNINPSYKQQIKWLKENGNSLVN